MEFGPACTTILALQCSGIAFLTFLFDSWQKILSICFLLSFVILIERDHINNSFSPPPASAGPFLLTVFHLPVSLAPYQYKFTLVFFLTRAKQTAS